jgi:hypothetical protein
MSIDTTVKVGFDGSAVKGGLKNIGGMFGKFSKEVGIGAARKVGEIGTDILGSLVQQFAAVPGMFMNYTGDLVDLSNATGESIEKLQLLQRAFGIAGVESIDTSKTIYTLHKAIADARDEAASGTKGPILEVFDKLGIAVSDIMNLKPVEQIEAIFNALNDPVTAPYIEQILQTLFGRSGVRLIQAFRDDFAGTMKRAGEDLGEMGKMTIEQAKGFEHLGDVIGMMDLVKMKLFRNLLVGIFGADIGETAAVQLQKIFDEIGKAGESLEKFGKSVKELFTHYGDIGFEASIKEIWTWLTNKIDELGSALGESIANGLTKFFEGTALGQLMSKAQKESGLIEPIDPKLLKYVLPRSTGDDLMSMFKSTTSANNPKTNFTSDIVKPLIDSLNVQQSTLKIMEQIYREEGGAAFQ